MPMDFLFNLPSDRQKRLEEIRLIEDYVLYNRNVIGEEEHATLDIVCAALATDSSFIEVNASQAEILKSVLGAQTTPIAQSAARFSETAPALVLYVPFVQRDEGDTFRTFIDENMDAFGLGKSVPAATRRQLVQDFYSTTGIRLGAAKRWGTPRGGNEFVEPADLSQVLDVYKWLDNQARKNGARVDILDYFASIYPPVASMISRSNGSDIVVRVPKFMEGTSFGEYSYATFALMAQRAGLVPEMPNGTKGHHIRNEVERPRWDTLDRYATLISQKADGDDAHRQQIFDFLVVLRLLSIFRNTFPIRDDAARLLTTPNPLIQTRYAIHIVPENELTEYLAFDGTAQFSVQRWPFSDIASGRMDRMFDILQMRLTTMKLLPSQIEGEESRLSEFEQRLGAFLIQHEIHKVDIQDRNAPSEVRTLEYLNKVKKFYREFNRFFAQEIFYNHLRGSVKQGNVSVPFEIVPQIGGTAISSLAGGRVTVFADDLIETAADERWSQEELETAFKLRVITNWEIASGAAKKEILNSTQGILDAGSRLDLRIDPAMLSKAANALVSLNQRVFVPDEVDASLMSLFRLRTTGTQTSANYYLYSRTPWQSRMREFYVSHNYSLDTLEADTSIAEAYFTSVRHPLFIYNEGELEFEISKTYNDAGFQQAAIERLTGFFRSIGVRTDPKEIHPLTPEETAPDLKAIEWAFQDYLELFPGAQILGAEMNEALLIEVVDRQIAEHPNVHLRRSFIMRGVKKAIEDFNSARTQPAGDVSSQRYQLPTGGLLADRFNSFAQRWERAEASTLDRERLLLAYNYLKNNGLSYQAVDSALLSVGVDEADFDDHVKFMFDWLSRNRAYREALESIVTADDVLKFLTKKGYASAFVSAEDIASITLTYIRQRFSSPQDIDVDSLIVSRIGDSFDPYPSIKAQAVTFHRMIIGEYVKDMYARVREKHEFAVLAIDDVRQNFAFGSYRDFEKTVLSSIGFAMPNGLRELDLQTMLLAEMLGESPPSEHLDDQMLRVYDEFALWQQELTLKNEWERLEKRGRFATAERELQKFIGQFEQLTFQYSAKYFVDGMDRDAIARTRARIETGLKLAAGLMTQLEGPLLNVWAEYTSLAEDKKVIEDDDLTPTLDGAPKTIEDIIDKLKGEEQLLEMRLQEIAMEERQTAVNSNTMDLVSQALNLQRTTETMRADIAGAAAEIANFQADNVGPVLNLPPATQSHEAYNAAWAHYEELTRQSEIYRVRLDEFKRKVDELLADALPTQLQVAHDIASGEAKRAVKKADEELIQSMLDAESALADTGAFLDTVNATLSVIEQKLKGEETGIALPAQVSTPSAADIPNKEIYTSGDSITYFNMATPSANPVAKVARFKEMADSFELLVVGNNSYIVDASVAARARTWIASARQRPFAGADVFGVQFQIEAGFRGVRVANIDRAANPNHPLAVFQRKLSYAVEVARSYETDFVLKLYDASTRNSRAASLWLEFLADLSSADIESGNDARRFIRQFALSGMDKIIEINLISKFTGTWFVEQTPLFTIALSEAEMADLNNRSIDSLIQRFGQIVGADKAERMQIAKEEFSEALRPFLGSEALRWWESHANEIPDIFAIAWLTTGQAFRADILRHILLSDFSRYLEEKRREGGGSITMPINETVRFATHYLLENAIEIRFGKMLYDDDKKLYDYGHHANLAIIYKRRYEHPELETMGILGKYYEVTHEEAARFEQELSHDRSGDLTISYYNWATQSLDQATFPKRELNFHRRDVANNPEVKHARLLYRIYNEPRFLGLGYMIGEIFHERQTAKFRKLLELLGQIDSPEHEPVFTDITKLELSVEKLYRNSANNEPVDVYFAYLDTGPAENRGSTVVGLFEPDSSAFDQAVRRIAETIDLSLATYLNGTWELYPSEDRMSFVTALAKLAIAVRNRQLMTETTAQIGQALNASMQQNYITLQLNTAHINSFFRSSHVSVLPSRIPIQVPINIIPVVP